MNRKTAALVATIAGTALFFLAAFYDERPCPVCESPGHDPRAHAGYPAHDPAPEPVWAADGVRVASLVSNPAGTRHRATIYTDDTDFAASLYTAYVDLFDPTRLYRVEIYDCGPAPAPYKAEPAEPEPHRAAADAVEHFDGLRVE